VHALTGVKRLHVDSIKPTPDVFFLLAARNKTVIVFYFFLSFIKTKSINSKYNAIAWRLYVIKKS
jgi:hypothetical protein